MIITAKVPVILTLAEPCHHDESSEKSAKPAFLLSNQSGATRT
jgi:hypothetical protein